MIPIKCIECVHCLPKTSSFLGVSYYPRDCGVGMTFDADIYCDKTFPEFKDSSKSIIVDRSSRRIIVSDTLQLNLFDYV